MIGGGGGYGHELSGGWGSCGGDGGGDGGGGDGGASGALMEPLS